MTTRNFVLTIDILYLLVGGLGFFPGLVSAPHAGAPSVTVDSGYGYLFGLFPVNMPRNLVHFAIGFWALSVYRNLPQSITFARGLAILYGVLTVMGLIPALNTTFGLMPLFGHDVWLHAATAVIAAYVGYGRTAEVVPLEWEARRAS
jgi:Domain of unknown function (DUF4383)